MSSPTESRKVKPTGLKLLETAPVTWSGIVEKMTSAEVQEAERFLSGVCERAARLIGYLEQRGALGCGDCGHAAGVQGSNTIATKVRRALGYAQPRHDITF